MIWHGREEGLFKSHVARDAVQPWLMKTTHQHRAERTRS
jgi:hypothetical protein